MMGVLPVDWYCACDGTLACHPWADLACPRCGYRAPERPPEPFALSADERARALGLIEWLDQQIAARPDLTRNPMIGVGVSALLKAARENPDARYLQLTHAGEAVDAIVAWVTQQIPPAPDFLDRLLGPASEA